MIDPSTGIKLQFIWDNAVVGFAMVAEDGRFMSANPRFCEMLGYTESELVLKKFQDITVPEDLHGDVSQAAEVARGAKDSYKMTKRYITKMGEVIWVSLTVKSWKSDDGKFLYFFSQITTPDLKAEPPKIVVEKRPDMQDVFAAFAGLLADKRVATVLTTVIIGVLGYVAAKLGVPAPIVPGP